MPIPFLSKKKEKTYAELEEDNERLAKLAENEELQLSIAQKQALRKKLDDAGLTVKNDFGGSLRRAVHWFKTH